MSDLATSVSFLRAKLVQILEHIEAILSDTWEEGDQNGDPLWEALDRIHGLTMAALRPEDCEYYQTDLNDGEVTP